MLHKFLCCSRCGGSPAAPTQFPPPGVTDRSFSFFLFLFPFFVTLLVLATGFLKAHPEELFLFQIGMLAVCAPPATLLTQFAVMFRKDAFLGGSVNLISMVLCVITMPLMIALFTYLAG